MIGGNNGTLQGGATFGAGKVGQAFSFDGVSAYVTTANNVLSTPTALTMDAWVKPGTQSANRRRIVAIEGAYIISMDLDGTVECIADGEEQNTFAHSSRSIVDGSFHHVACTNDGATTRLYLDGVPDGTAPETLFNINTLNRSIVIGNNVPARGDTQFYQGLVDEVEIFNSALTQAEIQSLYNASSVGKCNTAPVANNQSVTTNEDTPVNVTLAATDADGNFLNYAVTNPAHGTLTGTAPNLTYTPALNYNGADSFTFKVNDGFVDSSTATVSITINSVNDPPVASCQDITKYADGNCQANVSAAEVNNGSSDPDGNALSYSLSPAGPYSVGTTNVTLTVNDGNGGASNCAATITVIDNTPPTISCPTATVGSADANCQAAVPNVIGSVAASDNCTAAGSLTKTQSPTASTLVGIGTTTITVTVKDAAGNPSICTTTFTVKDTTSPNLAGSPQPFDWVNVNISGSTPSPRTGHRMVYDPVRHKVILFGGHDPRVHASGNYVLTSHLNDVWANRGHLGMGSGDTYLGRKARGQHARLRRIVGRRDGVRSYSPSSNPIWWPCLL